MSEGLPVIEEWVYGGLRSDGKKPWQAWYPVVDGEALPNALAYHRLLRSASRVLVGAIFEIHTRADRSQASCGEFLRHYGDTERVALWRADEAVYTAQLANAKASGTGPDPIEEAMRPLLRLAMRMNRSQRRALAIFILQELLD